MTCCPRNDINSAKLEFEFVAPDMLTGPYNLFLKLFSVPSDLCFTQQGECNSMVSIDLRVTSSIKHGPLGKTSLP